jgi:hypothetical protein
MAAAHDTPARGRLVRGVAAAACALAAAGPLVGGVPAALAQAPAPPACPEPPAEYSGTNDVVAELRAERTDAAASCAALAARLEQVHDDTGPLPAKLDAVKDTTAPLVAKLDELKAAVAAIGQDSTLPLYTTTPDGAAGTVELSATDRAQMTDNTDTLRGAIWFLVGAVVGLPFAYLLLTRIYAA